MADEKWYAVYRKSDGEIMSVGSVLGKLPPEYASKVLAAPDIKEPETSGVDFSKSQWNKETLLFEDKGGK